MPDEPHRNGRDELDAKWGDREITLRSHSLVLVLAMLLVAAAVGLSAYLQTSTLKAVIGANAEIAAINREGFAKVIQELKTQDTGRDRQHERIERLIEEGRPTRTR